MAKRLFIRLLQNVHPLTSVLMYKLGKQDMNQKFLYLSSSYSVQNCQLSNKAFVEHVSLVCPSLVLLGEQFRFCEETLIIRNAVFPAWQDGMDVTALSDR